MKQLSPISILLIEDDFDDIFFQKQEISKSKINGQIDVFRDGVDGIDFLKAMGKKGSSDLLPDLILLDINLPKMNGWEFLEHFEQLPDTLTRRCKIVMLTNSLNPEDEKKGLRNPFVSRFVIKPMKADELLRVLKFVLPHKFEEG